MNDGPSGSSKWSHERSSVCGFKKNAFKNKTCDMFRNCFLFSGFFRLPELFPSPGELPNGRGWLAVGSQWQRLAGGWLAVGWRLAGDWLAIGWRLAGGWLAVGWRLAGGWLAVGWRLVGGWLAVGWRLAGGWLVAGWWLAGWRLAGWRLVGGCAGDLGWRPGLAAWAGGLGWRPGLAAWAGGLGWRPGLAACSGGLSVSRTTRADSFVEKGKRVM